MKASVKMAWLKALRSGRYLQNRKGLRTEHKFCCLGVLCDLHRRVHHGKWDLFQVADEGYDYRYLGECLFLPKEVQEWAGIDSCDPVLRMATLSTHNDGGCGVNDDTVEPKNFKEISYIIERDM